MTPVDDQCDSLVDYEGMDLSLTLRIVAAVQGRAQECVEAHSASHVLARGVQR